MAELRETSKKRVFRARHRGRSAQVWIYLGKMLRMFLYQNDWKVLPMAALVAGLVGMVIRRRFFINMEGTLMGAFAMVCVCIWNGCFNSIQVVCRERDVIKREHRSGMHISSYVFSHMLYQGLLCLFQTGVTLYVTQLVGVKYPVEGLFTPWFIVDIGISMFLIAFASDMLSLWVSCLAHTTTTAMTIMPFVLIFQLVFSGGMLTLPAWTEPLTHLTISNPGLKVIAAQADTNNRPFVTISDMLHRMRDNEVGGTMTLGQVLDVLSDTENPSVAALREKQIGGTITVGELDKMLKNTIAQSGMADKLIEAKLSVGDVLKYISESKDLQALRETSFGLPGFTVGKMVEEILNTGDDSLLSMQAGFSTTFQELLDFVESSGFVDRYSDRMLGGTTTVGAVVDWLSANPGVQVLRGEAVTVNTTLGKLMDFVGEEKVRHFLEARASAASYKPEYEYSRDNILNYWMHLIGFLLVFALFSTITLEFIDKDKR